jgi:SP family sugar:H+ symporter-like MFS transporter
MIGSIGMSVTLALVVYAFSTGSLEVSLASGQETLKLSDNMGMLALIAANAYVMLFNFSWGPVMWVMLGEMFPNQIRGLGLAIAGISQWGANFIVTLTFPMLLGSMGLAFAYSLYTIGAILSVYFVYKFVYETKGLELEEIDKIWKK